MSSSLSVNLVYGIRIDVDALEEDPDTYHPLAGTWYVPPPDDEDTDEEDGSAFLDQAMREYLSRKTDLSVVEYGYQLERLLEGHCGLRMVTYGANDWSATILAVYDSDGYTTKQIIPREVLATDTTEWDSKLMDFVLELELQPKQKRAEWMVCASYG